MPESQSLPDQRTGTMRGFRCPRCGFTTTSLFESDTHFVWAHNGRVEAERIEVVPKADAERLHAALTEIQKVAAREWAADETNYEWYGDIAGIAEEALGLEIGSGASDEQEPPC